MRIAITEDKVDFPKAVAEWLKSDLDFGIPVDGQVSALSSSKILVQGASSNSSALIRLKVRETYLSVTCKLSNDNQPICSMSSLFDQAGELRDESVEILNHPRDGVFIARRVSIASTAVEALECWKDANADDLRYAFMRCETPLFWPTDKTRHDDWIRRNTFGGSLS
jgi:hypothetical protein